MEKIDIVMVGAEGVVESGGIINKVMVDIAFFLEKKEIPELFYIIPIYTSIYMIKNVIAIFEICFDERLQ